MSPPLPGTPLAATSLAVTSSTEPLRLSLPTAPQPVSRPPFPLVGSLAPLGVSVVLWLVTQSPLSLVFGLLAPVVACAALVDARAHAVRGSKRGQREYAHDVVEFRRELGALHAREREALGGGCQTAADLLAGSARFWGSRQPGEVCLRLGAGDRASAVRIDGGSAGRPTEVERGLRAEASRVTDAPVLVDAAWGGIAVVGPLPQARAIARGFILQLAGSIDPAGGCFMAVADDSDRWGWLAILPHSGDEPIAVLIERSRSSGWRPDAGGGRNSTGFALCVCDDPGLVPPGVSAIVQVGPDSSTELTLHPRPGNAGPLNCEYVTEQEAEGFATLLAKRADAVGRQKREFPSSLSLDELGLLPPGSPPGSPTGAQPSAADSLAAPIGADLDGEVWVDLVRDGPHAVVGGTTGSGKSELLVTWVASLARRYPASELTVLLVDFKGGSSFDALTGLEHCVGLITDLDAAEAARALTSLKAELRFRERRLRDAGAKDIAELLDSARAGEGLGLPRLVIVVDEFAAMLGDFPELHELFADLAARGRSLGIHLILCTQRPAGVVRDSLLANCDLRMSLRVNNAADSTALIGTGEAARLPAHPRGRCLVASAATDPRMIQVARAARASIGTLALRTARVSPGGGAPRRPWREPLPSVLALSSLTEEGERSSAESGESIAFGRFDLPENQAQPVARYDPSRQGSLLVVGAARSGKTTLLDTLARSEQPVQRLPADAEGAWDALQRLAGAGAERRSGRAELVTMDDLDRLLSMFDQEYQGEVLQLLTLLLRDGPRRGLVVGASVTRLSGPLASLAPYFAERILLRLASKQEHLLAEGALGDFDPRLPPGGGWWNGRRLQVATDRHPDGRRARLPPVARPRAGDDDGRAPIPAKVLVVSTTPARFLASGSLGAECAVVELAELRAGLGVDELVSDVAAQPAIAVVGEPDAWLARWSLLTALKSRIPVLFDSCSVADFKAVSRRRELPPVLDPGSPRRWLLQPEGGVVRAR